jgi:hypothetical protein
MNVFRSAVFDRTAQPPALTTADTTGVRGSSLFDIFSVSRPQKHCLHPAERSHPGPLSGKSRPISESSLRTGLFPIERRAIQSP